MKTSNNLVITQATGQDLDAVRQLGGLCSGSHNSVPIEELEKIIKKGAIFLLHRGDELIGESRVILSKFEGCQEFPLDSAYCYGAIIHPDYNGLGLYRLLADEQEKFAKENKKSELYSIVQVENYSNLKMSLDFGFRITGYDEFFYGKNPEQDARIILTKKIKYSKRDFFAREFVSVSFSQQYDEVAHQKIKGLMNKVGYVGFEVLEGGITFGKEFL